MAYEHKDGTFTLFKVKQKKSPKGPDYTGTGKGLDGSAIEVAGWLKGGEPQFLSCTLKVKQASEQRPQQPADEDGDTPF